MTTDALFSANFRIYDSAGIDHQFTVRTDENGAELVTQLGALKQHLLAHGYSATLQVAKAGRQVLVDAACIGRFEDKRSNDYKTCIHFYGTNGKFKVATVYPEKFGDIPDYIRQAIKDAKLRSLDSAPERDRAAGMGALATFAPATIILEARTDFDGNPILSDAGKQTYKFASFAGHVANGGTAAIPEAEVASDVPF